MKKVMERGFTLIELLVVIAIIGILAAVVLASLGDARENGRNASIQGSMNSFRNQMELLYNANNFSYNGQCCSAALNSLYQAVVDNGPATASSTDTANNQTAADVDCNDGTGTVASDVWAASAPLNDVGAGVKYFCVDSTGVAGIRNSVLTAGATACPAS